jgi:hypothetical protein
VARGKAARGERRRGRERAAANVPVLCGTSCFTHVTHVTPMPHVTRHTCSQALHTNTYGPGASGSVEDTTTLSRCQALECGKEGKECEGKTCEETKCGNIKCESRDSRVLARVVVLHHQPQRLAHAAQPEAEGVDGATLKRLSSGKAQALDQAAQDTLRRQPSASLGCGIHACCIRTAGSIRVNVPFPCRTSSGASTRTGPVAPRSPVRLNNTWR